MIKNPKEVNTIVVDKRVWSIMLLLIFTNLITLIWVGFWKRDILQIIFVYRSEILVYWVFSIFMMLKVLKTGETNLNKKPLSKTKKILWFVIIFWVLMLSSFLILSDDGLFAQNIEHKYDYIVSGSFFVFLFSYLIIGHIGNFFFFIKNKEYEKTTIKNLIFPAYIRMFLILVVIVFAKRWLIVFIITLKILIDFFYYLMKEAKTLNKRKQSKKIAY